MLYRSIMLYIVICTCMFGVWLELGVSCKSKGDWLQETSWLKHNLVIIYHLTVLTTINH